MTVEFRLQPDDAPHIHRLYTRRMRRKFGLKMGVISSGVVGACFWLGSPAMGLLYGGAVGLMVAAVSVVGKRVGRLMSGQTYRLETTVSGFALVGPGWRRDYQWKQCAEWVEDEAVVLLFLAVHHRELLLPLPKRDFTEDQLDELRLLREG